MTSKYDRLTDYLATVDAPAVTLSFGEVERLVGPLSAAARRTGNWWGASARGRYRFAQTMQWW